MEPSQNFISCSDSGSDFEDTTTKAKAVISEFPDHFESTNESKHEYELTLPVVNKSLDIEVDGFELDIKDFITKKSKNSRNIIQRTLQIYQRINKHITIYSNYFKIIIEEIIHDDLPFWRYDRCIDIFQICIDYNIVEITQEDAFELFHLLVNFAIADKVFVQLVCVSKLGKLLNCLLGDYMIDPLKFKNDPWLPVLSKHVFKIRENDIFKRARYIERLNQILPDFMRASELKFWTQYFFIADYLDHRQEEFLIPKSSSQYNNLKGRLCEKIQIMFELTYL